MSLRVKIDEHFLATLYEMFSNSTVYWDEQDSVPNTIMRGINRSVRQKGFWITIEKKISMP